MSKTLLLADDSVTIQRVVELTFAHEDVRVVSISDGDRAMQWLESDRPDLVLVDVAIPEVDGYAIASHVKKSKRHKGVPVLLMAGAFEPVDENRSRKIGCDGIIVKPFEPQRLVERVKERLWANGHGDGHGDDESKPADVLPHPGRRKQPSAPEGIRKVMHMPASGPSIEELQRETRGKTTELPKADVPSPQPAPTPSPAPTGGGSSSLPSLESLQAKQAEAQSRGEAWVPSNQAPPPPKPIELELPDRPFWHDATPAPSAPPPVAEAPAPPPTPVPSTPAPTPKVTLVNAFTALLAAEKSSAPAATEPPAAQAQAVSDATVEEAVRRALVRMTDELVRRIVLETAERLIKEEIEKIKADPE